MDIIGRGFSLELTRKHIANMFYNAELEGELSDCVSLRKEATYFKSDRDRDGFMSQIESNRVFNSYPHDQLATCEDKGVCFYLR